MTATALPEDRDRITESLGMLDPEKIILSVDKPNLSIIRKEVVHDRNCGSREHILRLMKTVRNCIRKYSRGESTIVYCLTPDAVEMTANYLRGYDPKNIVVSHGKLSREKRSKNELAFLSGEKQIMVASSAFGQGVDKPDIRLIIHLGLPLSVVDYYQQIGRAGRDGGKARAVVIYDDGLMKVNEALIKGAHEAGKDRMKRRQRHLQEIINGEKCIMQQILEYLGEERKKPCNHCTVCQGGRKK